MSKLKREIEKLREEMQENFEFYCKRDYLIRTNFIGTLTNEKLIEDYKKEDDFDNFSTKLLKLTLVIKDLERKSNFEINKQCVENCDINRIHLIRIVNSMYKRLKEFEEKQETLDKYKEVMPTITTSNITYSVNPFLTAIDTTKKEEKKKPIKKKDNTKKKK